MGKFTVIPLNTFQGLQLDAGVLLKHFDPNNPVAPADRDIISATTGGINIVCQPTYSDLGEDVDNCPNNMKELKHVDSWDCRVSTNCIGTDAETIRLSLGAADIDAENSAIIPRRDLKQSDFSDLWWVGDRADGGLVAVQVKNALSTDGFSLQTTKSGKGQIALGMTGHVSLDSQDEMPMTFYSLSPDSETRYSVTQDLTHVTSDFTGHAVKIGTELAITLTADEGYEISDVTVFMAGVDVTSTAYDSETGIVTISSVAGNIIIVAVAEEEQP